MKQKRLIMMLAVLAAAGAAMAQGNGQAGITKATKLVTKNYETITKQENEVNKIKKKNKQIKKKKQKKKQTTKKQMIIFCVSYMKTKPGN